MEIFTVESSFRAIQGVDHRAGATCQGFVIEQLLAAPAVDANFYRTAHGAEADLVLRFYDSRPKNHWLFRESLNPRGC